MERESGGETPSSLLLCWYFSVRCWHCQWYVINSVGQVGCWTVSFQPESICMIITTSSTHALSVYYLIFSTTYLSIRGSIPSGCCIFHSGTLLPRITPLKQSNSGAKFASLGWCTVYIYVHFLFSFFRVSEMSRHFSGLWSTLTLCNNNGSGFALTVLSSLRGTRSLRFGSLSFGAVRRSTVVARSEYAGNYRSLECWLSCAIARSRTPRFCRASFNPNCNYPAF